MGLAFAGVVIDVPVREIERAEQFYTILIGRPPDLQVRPTEREWRLLAGSWPDIGEVKERPNIIALLDITDPDGSEVILWQDLLARRLTGVA